MPIKLAGSDTEVGPLLALTLMFVAVIAAAYILKYAWNETMPHLFGLKEITAMQAFWLSVLANILIRDNCSQMYNSCKKVCNCD